MKRLIMSYETYFRLTANKQQKIQNISTSALLHSEHFSVMWHFLCWIVLCFSAVSGRAKQELFFQYLSLTDIFFWNNCIAYKYSYYLWNLLFNHDDWRNNSTVQCLLWAVKMLVWTSNSILRWCYGTMRFVTVMTKFTITYSTPL